MKRLYYLTRTLDSTERISDNLHSNGITDWHFHIISRDDAGVMRRRLHSADFWHRLDITHSAERGLLLGAVFGALIVVPMMLLSPWANTVHWLVWTSIFVFCVMAGAWIGGMAGVNMENYKIRRFHSKIDQGNYLIMIDVPRKQVDRLRSLMASQHPEAELQAIDSNYANPMKATEN
jgi:hypothetical protein